MMFAEPLTVISETASPSMWLFEPLMTTVLVPAGISTCVLDSSIVKVPAASDLPESLEVSDLPESLDASVLVSVRGFGSGRGLGSGRSCGGGGVAAGHVGGLGAAGEGHGGDGESGRSGKEGLQGHGVSLSLIGRS